MAERMPQCLDDIEPPFPVLAFLAPKWRHLRGRPNRLLLRGRLAQAVTMQTRLGLNGFLEGTAFTAAIERYFINFLQILTTPAHMLLTGELNLPELVSPDEDMQVFVASTLGAASFQRHFRTAARNTRGERNENGLIEGEINTDITMTDDWFPPVGQEIRIYGEFVEDLSHDFKTEIHPIHWITWRHPQSSTFFALYRASVFNDTSGRYAAGVPVNAMIRYDLSEVFSTIPPLHEIVAYTVTVQESGNTPPVLHRISPLMYEFRCTVDGRAGANARHCQTTRRHQNRAGYWDGWIVFTLQYRPFLFPPSSSVPNPPPYFDPAYQQLQQTQPRRPAQDGGPRRPVGSRVRSVSSVERRSGGQMVRTLDLSASIRFEGKADSRDRVRRVLYTVDDAIPLMGTGPSIEARLELPLRDDPWDRRLFGPEPRKLPLIERQDPLLHPALLVTTVERDGNVATQVDLVRLENAIARIDCAWGAMRAVEGGEGQLVEAKARISVWNAAQFGKTARFEWEVFSDSTPLQAEGARASVVLRLEPAALIRATFVARVSVFVGETRVALGRCQILPPVPALRLKRSARGKQRRFEAVPENMVGEITFTWSVSSRSGDVSWTAEGPVLTVNVPGKPERDTVRILGRARDSVGFVGAVQAII